MHGIGPSGAARLLGDGGDIRRYRLRLAEGEPPLEALRALKRRLSDVIYRLMLADTKPLLGTGRGGHPGATLASSAADLNPRGQHLGKVTSRTRHAQGCPMGW